MTDSTTPIPLKRCTKCGEEKTLTHENFSYDKKITGGFARRCKECTNEYNRAYYQRNQERVKANVAEYRAANLDKVREHQRNRRQVDGERMRQRQRAYYEAHKATIGEKNKLWREQNREWMAGYNRAYREQNRNRLNEKKREWYAQNREQLRQWHRDNYRRNKDRILEKNRRWRATNPEWICTYTREWAREYAKKNPTHSRIVSALRRARKRAAGGSFTKQDLYIAYRSQQGRCWHCGARVGLDYHADHLIPLAKGGSNDARNIVISCEACNRSKGAKFCWQWNGRLF